MRVAAGVARRRRHRRITGLALIRLCARDLLTSSWAAHGGPPERMPTSPAHRHRAVVGAIADLTVCELTAKPIDLYDGIRDKRVGRESLEHVSAIKEGKVFRRSAIS